jgi:hypothetical protein
MKLLFVKFIKAVYLPVTPMEKNSEQTLSERPVDHVTLVVKGAIGVIPIAGPLLAEIAGTLIPNQRVDRLVKFAQQLRERLENTEDHILRAHLSDENFTDAVEESLRQAARSTSDERRAYIASILANGINLDNLDFIETKHLLRLLGEINDTEVAWLRLYYNLHMPQRDEGFYHCHAAILEPVFAHMGSTQKDTDRASMQESYKFHLESLGLLRQKIQTNNKTKLPDFDKNKGFKKFGFEITSLGELLVRYINVNPLHAES